jgi:hypothetical protein
MEELMQYIWQHKLWPSQGLKTVDGRTVQIIDPGLLNKDAGPDFFNAKIKIGGEMWSGNVEIHIRASDWRRHKHHLDMAYDSVILHVVGIDDLAIKRTNGETIPQLLMPCTPDIAGRINAFINDAHNELACAHEIANIPEIYLTDWISSLAHQRLCTKTTRIQELLTQFNNDWEEVCYITFARALGFGINGEPLQRLAKSLPLRFMRKHSDSLTAMEALLFGQAGFLDAVAKDDAYTKNLYEEYMFLAHKFSLIQPQALGWKMARMRPPNFPHRRIALLAASMEGGFRMMSKIIEARTIEQATAIFDIPLTGYWASRYNFGPTTGQSLPTLSQASTKILVINVVIPLMYAYGMCYDNNEMCDRAMNILQHLPPEQNSIVRLFTQAGIKCNDAFTSQALIELRHSYCETRKCLYCRFGHRLLSAKIKP